MLTQYTSYDEIRAAIGVAPEEITDEVLALPANELVLKFDLDDLGSAYTPTLLEEFVIVTTSPYSTTASVDENNFADTLRLYATYVIARHLLRTLEMFAPKTVKDAKTELVRSTDPYADTRTGVESFYWLMQSRLLAAYLKLFPSASARTVVTENFLTAVGLAADPVTGV